MRAIARVAALGLLLLLAGVAARAQQPPAAAESSAVTIPPPTVPGALLDSAAAAPSPAGIANPDTVAAAVHNPFGLLYRPKRTVILVALLLYGALVVGMIRKAQRGADLKVRKIAGLEAVEEAVGRATEMGKPVLYVPGIDDANNIQTIYAMMILAHIAKTTARYETPIIVPICKPFVVPLAEETVKQASLDAGFPEAYNPNNIRYLSDEQFAFTAGVDGIMLRERPAANLYFGSFYAESLILAETGFQTGAIQIAGTANIHQLPFFVVACDYTLIGEEFFAATAYLSREPRLIGTLKGTDYMKAILLAFLVLGVILETAGVKTVTRLLNFE
jgi:hypothetical protein